MNHQCGSLTGTPGSSSSSKTHSSPSRALKRPRDRNRDAEIKGSAIMSLMRETPIKLVYTGNPEFARRQRYAIDNCSRAVIYQHPVYKHVSHLFHLHVFDPTATPAQLPQYKKNAMLETQQLYRTWNFKANKVIQGSSNKKWDEWQATGDERLKNWHQVTEMLAWEKERQIRAGFIALNPPQKTRNYGRRLEPRPQQAAKRGFQSETGHRFFGDHAGEPLIYPKGCNVIREPAQRATLGPLSVHLSIAATEVCSTPEDTRGDTQGPVHITLDPKIVIPGHE
ncbi:unnamed protein product [Caenorhabditis brenneri]